MQRQGCRRWDRVALLGCIATIQAGCTDLPWNTETKSHPSNAPAERRKPAPSKEQDEESLAAVEDFLQRTKSYEAAPDLTRSAETLGALEPPRPGRPAARTVETVDRSVAPKNSPADDPSIGENTRTAQSGGESEKSPAPTPSPPIVVANERAAVEETDTPHLVAAIPALQSVSVRSTVEKELGEFDRARAASANVPVEASPADTVGLLGGVLGQLQARAAKAKDFDSQWRLRMLQLAMDRDSEALQPWSDVSEGTQTLMTALFEANASLRNLARNPMLTGESSLAAVENLKRIVAERSDPVIATVALCRKVVTFGSYEEMPKEEFLSGRNVTAIVYTELVNLRSERTADGFERTQLSSRVELMTPEGKEVWRHEEPTVLDQCRRRRSDFFLAQRITLPATLPAGDYVLKVRVEDKLASRAAESAQPLSILSPLSVAKNR